MKDIIFKNKDRMDILALSVCLFALIFWLLLLSYKYTHFGYYDWDLAFFAQGMWNLCHGSGFVSLFDANIFSNHANLIAFLVLPIYKIFPHPLTLVYLKVISYITAAYVLYVLAKERLDATSGILILWLYLSYIPNIFGILYEFDFESLAPAFLMLILYFYLKDNWQGFLICAVVLMIIKENLPLIILAFSIHALFVKKDKVRWAIIPGLLSVISFCLLVLVFIPLMSSNPIGTPSHYYIANNYSSLGGSLQGITCNIIFHPLKTLSLVMTPLNLSFLVAMFNPMMYLPFGSPGILFLIAPIFIQHLLSSAATEHNIRYFYVMTMAPFLFLATIETLRFFKEKLKKEYRLTLFLLLFINLLILFVNFNVFQQRFLMTESFNEPQQTVHARWELVHLIPQDASVVASFSFLAPLSQRKDLYAFYKTYDPKYQNNTWTYPFPSNVRYALIDTRDPWILTEDNYELAQARAQKFLKIGHWNILKNYGRYVLFTRKAV